MENFCIYLDWLKEHGYTDVRLIGGEPTLHPHLEQLIDKVIEYDYFDDEPFEPRIYYYDSNETEYEDEETLSAHGVKLVDFEYPTPIKNSFVLISHRIICFFL